MIVCVSSLIFSVFETLLQRDADRAVRYRSALFVGIGGGLIRTLLRLLLLPAEAWTCLSAAVSALWRMTVTHKNLLQWTTAQQDEARGKEGPGALYRSMWFSPAAGCMLLSGTTPETVQIW